MSSHRPRRIALAAAALLVGAPLVWSASASAATGDDVVTFRGGCGLQLVGALGRVTPDPQHVTVRAGEQVRFVNRLSRQAVLRFDGEAAVELPNGTAATVIFHGGPVTATMDIDCLLGGVSGSATVAVLAASPSAPPPGRADAPPTVQPDPQPSPTVRTSAPETPDEPAGDAHDAAGEPAVDQGQPDAGGDSATAGDAPAAAASPRVPVQTPAPQPGAAVDTAPDDVTMPSWNLQPDSGAGHTRTHTDTSAAEGQPGEGAEHELAHVAGSEPRNGPSGLLALVATVCVAGATAAAIRAILAQRAARLQQA